LDGDFLAAGFKWSNTHYDYSFNVLLLMMMQQPTNVFGPGGWQVLPARHHLKGDL